MTRCEIKRIYETLGTLSGRPVTICGWVRTLRHSGAIAFVELNDGSCLGNLQVVVHEADVSNFEEVVKYGVGTALKVIGDVRLTPDAKQSCEVIATDVTLLGASTPDYPLQKKRHTLEYLRSIAHLRPRTNTFSAVFRVRSEAAFAIHDFFHGRGFVYAHTPIITGSDAEGAGEMFRVTTLDPKTPPLTETGDVNFAEDFFGKLASLTVSGQLEAETFALAFGNVYTFGPTFRAENSHTARHASEFWMIEPEIAFADLDDNMDLARDMLQHIFKHVLKTCPEELSFFSQFYDKELIDRLTKLSTADFAKVTYTDAIAILEEVKDRFSYPVFWGCDLQTEHERYLSEEHFGGPVFVTNYPKEIKAFYMRLDEGEKTVSAMDLLVPGIGEIIGGSQREERLDVLTRRIAECELDMTDYEWYLDLRRYGSVCHAGYGLGFERLIMYLTGMSNIRDVLPFPRTPGSAEF